MKRHGQLMPKIADAENLRLAFWKAAKGKRGKAAFRRHCLQRFGVAAKRLQPGESGRQLQQQRDQLPDGESQQQPGQQQQQQYRVPLRPHPSSTSLPAVGGADPAAILSGANEFWPANKDSKPSGASRLAEPVENSGRNYSHGNSN